MDKKEEIRVAAIKNYSTAEPWPQNDAWHRHTYLREKKIIEKWLDNNANDSMTILNAGSGGTEYKTGGKVIHLDIIEEYISRYEHYIVGSVERIALSDNSVDGIICVGSVINYCDAQKVIIEFSRILNPGGFLILEFERSNSAEFLWTKNYGNAVFWKTYHYNGQIHPMWLYSEKHIRLLFRQYNIRVIDCRRIHCFSSLLNRFGVSEENAAPYVCLDPFLHYLSYPFSHNTLLLGRKEFLPKGDYGNNPRNK